MTASAQAARRAVVVNPLAARRAMTMRPGLGLSSNHLSRHNLLSRRSAMDAVALAFLVPVRHVSTEPHRSGGIDTGPPPGFNTAEAKKKPLPAKGENGSKQAGSKKSQEEEKTTKSTSASSVTGQSKSSAYAAQAGVATGLRKGSGSGMELAEKPDLEVAKTEEKPEKKLTLGQRIKHEIQHYWDGTKLLATEIKISSRLALKMAAGYELTRRENRQLQRTVQDLARLVPFSVFIIVPFAEALLPVALRLFPNLLPSTYEGKKSKEKKAASLRATRREVSDFLQGTLRESGLRITPATTQREEFSVFFRKLRATGERPTAEDVIKVCQIFRDDLTLDNLSRPQLVSMCRYMNLTTFGTDMMLRYQIRHRMRQIKRDDKVISFEGVDSLNVPELQTACGSRGIKSHGVSPARLRDDLQSWLALRLKHGVPSTLLVLSNAYMYGRDSSHSPDDAFDSQIEALTGVLSSIPEELYHEIELEVHSAEGAATNKQRLEVLKEQEELIDEENEQNQENADTGMATPRDVEDIDEKQVAGRAEAEAAADVNLDGQVATKEGVEKKGEESEKKVEK